MCHLKIRNKSLAENHQRVPSNSETFKSMMNFMMLVLMSITPAYATSESMKRVSLHSQTGLQPVGAGTITWFGFTIYDASLWTENGRFANLTDSLPVALHITYRKNIKSSELAERTAEEWQQLNIYTPSERQQWQQRLATIWPTVKPGDSITTLVTDDRQTHFYYNNELIHRIDDPEFGIALLSIWLHPNTSQPELRNKLIGQRKG